MADEDDDETMPWIGFDLDGTLAHHGKWKGTDHIGEPIDKICKLLQKFREQGYKIKIMTARVCRKGPEREKAIKAIKAWCKKQFGEEYEVTNEKDFAMLLLIDDRCCQVETNTGRIIGELSEKI